MVVCRDVCFVLFDLYELINVVLIEIIFLLKDVREINIKNVFYNDVFRKYVFLNLFLIIYGLNF